MPSDAKITLASVLSSTALRLSALVAAAMSAGYLWRAAVEPGGTAATSTVAPPGLAAKPPDMSFNTLDVLRSAGTENAPAAGGRADAVARRAANADVRARSSARLISVTVGAPRPGSAARARPTHPVRANPPKNGRKPGPKTPPPPPRPNPPPPPAPQPPPPPPPPPPPVAPPAPPPPPPPPPVAGVETRPGRGRGDRNHVHTGPPGLQKPKPKTKQGQGNPGNGGSQGQSGSPGNQGNGHGNGRGGKKGKG